MKGVETWIELVKIFGSGITAGGVMGLWLWTQHQEKVKQTNRIEELTSYIQMSDKSTTQLMTEMKLLIATLVSNQDSLPTAIKLMLEPFEKALERVERNITEKSSSKS